MARLGNIAMEVLVLLALATMVLADDADRDARFWRTTSTQTIIEKHVFTKLEPSSCAFVPSTLSHCVADSSIAATATVKTAGATTTLQGSETSEGWGNKYLGQILPTQHIVTTTITKSETSTILDNNHVVTFSVVGCQPSRLPCDLKPCS